MIHPYEEADAPALTAIQNHLYPQQLKTDAGFASAVQDTIAGGGFAWTLVDSRTAGFASVTPVPGLPHIGELTGFIAQDKRRRGLGTKMLAQVIASLEPSAIQQISFPLADLNSPAGLFLKKNHFFLEHEESVMEHENLADLPPRLNLPGVAVRTFLRERTVSLFCQLFAETFCGLPWDQPYSMEEVAALLDRPDDILFLLYDDDPAGFAWIEAENQTLGVIEPLGIKPAFQGRGFGRYLLSAALHELAAEGIKRAQIGAWKSNHPAMHLYKSLGFKEKRTVAYLAFDLG